MENQIWAQVLKIFPRVVSRNRCFNSQCKSITLPKWIVSHTCMRRVPTWELAIHLKFHLISITFHVHLYIRTMHMHVWERFRHIPRGFGQKPNPLAHIVFYIYWVQMGVERLRKGSCPWYVLSVCFRVCHVNKRKTKLDPKFQKIPSTGHEVAIGLGCEGYKDSHTYMLIWFRGNDSNSCTCAPCCLSLLPALKECWPCDFSYLCLCHGWSTNIYGQPN